MYSLITRIFLTLYALLLMQLSFAADTSTIRTTSISWDDVANRTILLQAVPKWHHDVIDKLYTAYINPKQHQLPVQKDEQQHNLQFINAFWGPLDNPFVQFARPAKAFVILPATAPAKEQFFMAPIILDTSDGNYYVFTKKESKPVLLTEWISAIKANANTPILFNICQGYGSTPADNCSEKPYQYETKDTLKGLAMLHTQNNIPSAHREAHEDWKLKVRQSVPVSLMRDSIYDSSIAWNKVEARNKLLNQTVAWPNEKTINDNFTKIRDLRFFKDEKVANFLRRISWLYPDDGCWTRAASAVKDFFGPHQNVVNPFPRPSKVFAFGNLCANTPNARDGKVMWWYHTAPIVKNAETNQTYVLDPSINPYAPVTMEQWVEKISARNGACSGSNASVESFNVCTGYGAGPYDNCASLYINEANETLRQSTYRSYERARQESLGRNANEVLGHLPPWVS